MKALFEACEIALRSIGVDLQNCYSIKKIESKSIFEEVEAVACAAGVRSRAVRLPRDAWRVAQTPVVAIRVKDCSREAIALLPGTFIGRQLAGELEPAGYCFYRPFPNQSMSGKDIGNFVMTRTKTHLLGIAFICAIICALGFAVPFLTAMLFERIRNAAGIGHDNFSSSLMMLWGMVLAATMSVHLLDFVAVVLRLRMQAKISHVAKMAMMDRILNLPMTTLRCFSSIGELISRAGMADSEHERLFVAAFSSGLSGLFGASTLVGLFWLDIRLGITSLLIGACVLAAGLWIAASKLKIERDLLQAMVRVRSFLFQMFAGISKVRGAAAERLMFTRWGSLFRIRRSLERRLGRIESQTAVFHSVVPVCCTAILFLVKLSPERYLAFSMTFGLFVAGVLRLSRSFFDMACALPMFERARPIVLALPERGHRRRNLEKLSGRVELRNVSFRYATDAPLALKDVSVCIEPGQFVALVGPSGSGKSTLVRLLLGFETRASGEILYDGVKIDDLDIYEVRKQVGTVLQSDGLVNGSIYENIAASGRISFEQALNALDAAGFKRELERLPMGLHTFVSHEGRMFSGGERQRMMIARALAREPSILIFDEATSALDNDIQAEVMSNLQLRRMTRIVVAHRLSTVQKADLILAFDQGRIVERGTFFSLLKQDGLFARLARRQQFISPTIS